MSRIAIPSAVYTLLARLNGAGFEAYAVGGCVRDSLLGQIPQDWDICTSAKPEEIKGCFAGEKTILTGEKYGTVTVILGGISYEITTFRSECGYADSRHPTTVTFEARLQTDLSRRDFTVNAMAADKEGSVVDLFGGEKDLSNRVLRCVGQPEERFTEDALRMLRALRFASKLGFAVESETATVIHNLKSRLNLVASERLAKELNGLLLGKNVASVLREFPDVLAVFLPEFTPSFDFQQYNYHHIHNVWEHTLSVIENVPHDKNLRLAALFHDVGKPATFTMDKLAVGHFYGHAIAGAAMTEQALRRLHYDKATVEAVTLLVREHGFSLEEGNEKQLRRLLVRLSESAVRGLLSLRRADAIGTGTVAKEIADRNYQNATTLLEKVLQEEICFKIQDLTVGGQDLMTLGVPQGPKIGCLLQQLLEAVTDGLVQNQRDELLQFAQNLIANSENN